MMKEEQILFPMIKQGMGSQAMGPISVMESEHDDAGELLEVIKHLFAVAIVVTHDNVVDDFGKRGRAPLFVDGLLCQQSQLRFNNLYIQLFARGRTRQGLLLRCFVNTTWITAAAVSKPWRVRPRAKSWM